MGRRSNREERRAQIAEAMMRVMATGGYGGATIAAIASEAGLRSGLVHYHFASKREILLEVVGRLGEAHEARVSEALGCAEGAWGELEAYLGVSLGRGEGDSRLLASWVQVCAESLRDEGVREAYEGLMKGERVRLEGLIRRGVACGAFDVREGEEGEAAGALLAMAQGFLFVGVTTRGVIPEGSAMGRAMAAARGMLRRR